MIRSTFAAVPQRRIVLIAKAIVFVAVTLVVAEVACFIAFFIGQSIFSGKHIEASINSPGVLRAVVGGGIYLAVLGLLALALGALIRHTAGAIAILFGLLLLVPGLAHALPQSWQNTINQYLPSNAGQQIYQIHLAPHTLSPWSGLAIFCVYAGAMLASVTRRDA